MKKLIDIRTIVENSRFFSVKKWDDGSTEKKEISGKKLDNLITAIREAEKDLKGCARPNLKLIKGNKQDGFSDFLAVLILFLIGTCCIVLATNPTDDKCNGKNWYKYDECF